MPLSTKPRRLFVVAFVVVAFLSLGARTEWQDRQIRSVQYRQQMFEWNACQARVENVLSTLRLRAELAQVSDPAEADLYRRSTLVVPKCGPKPVSP